MQMCLVTAASCRDEGKKIKTYRCENVTNTTDGTKDRIIRKAAEIASKRLKPLLKDIQRTYNSQGQEIRYDLHGNAPQGTYVKVRIYIALKGKKVL